MSVKARTFPFPPEGLGGSRVPPDPGVGTEPIDVDIPQPPVPRTDKGQGFSCTSGPRWWVRTHRTRRRTRTEGDRDTSYVGTEAGESRTLSPRSRNDLDPTLGPVPTVAALDGVNGTAKSPGPSRLLTGRTDNPHRPSRQRTTPHLGPLHRGPSGRVSEEDSGSLDRGSHPTRVTDTVTDQGLHPWRG